MVAAYPQDAEAGNALGEILYGQGKFAEALTEFDKVLAIDPANAQAKKDRALAVKAIDK